MVAYVILPHISYLPLVNQHYAARNGHLGVCAMLIEHGASVNGQTKGTRTHTRTHARTHTPFPTSPAGGATPLHRAAYSGHTDIAQLLIRSGADVRLVDSDGKTALHKVGCFVRHQASWQGEAHT